MGIGTTVKNILGSDSADPEREATRTRGATGTEEGVNEPIHYTNSTRASRQLPSGTGPGTTGKTSSRRMSHGANYDAQTEARNLQSEAAMQRDLERSRLSGDISGYGTDAAAAAGGSLSNSHQGAMAGHTYDNTSTSGMQTTRDISTSTSASGPDAAASAQRASQAARDNIRATKGETSTSGLNPTSNLTSVSESSEIGRVGDDNVHIHREREVTQREYDVPRTSEGITGHHQFGHTKHSSKDSMPSANADEDTNQLQPVTHERVRHLETEEVSRVRELERHIHHIQHHTQPVVASEELAEKIHEHLIPVTTISETHSNKPEDTTLFEGQVNQYRDTLSHAAKERTVVDKGTIVKEHVHHHVHHVIQPIIEKETIDRHTIHTTIPIHEITHEAPVVHQSQTHAPVPLDHFLSRGGTLSGAIAQDQITKKVLRTGQCERAVDGVAENLERELHLEKSSSHGNLPTKKVMETDEQIRTTVAPIRAPAHN